MSDTDLNFFKHVEVIVASSAEELAAKLRMPGFPFQIVNIWSDGKKHFALVNAKKPFPARLRESLAK